MNPHVVRLPEDAITAALEQHETPFFLYEEARIRENCQRIKNAFASHFPNFVPLYAMKANSNPHILRVVASEGFGIDCSSEFEAYMTEQLGVFGMYTGNYTTREEFAYVLARKGILLNLDDPSMVPTVAALGMPEFLSFRINPGIAPEGENTFAFAGPDAKYGVHRDDAVHAYRLAKEAGAKRFGIHMMTGSNVLDPEYFTLIADKLLEIAGRVHQELGIEFEYVNIGGGFGVPYHPEEPSLDLERVASGLRAVFDRRCAEFGFREPKLMMEPGRFVTCDAGFLVTKVHVIKEGKTRFVGVDAGMNDLPRPAIYDAYHHITVLGKPLDGDTEEVNVVGRLCENNDQFAKRRHLPRVAVGDHAVIHNAGAHSHAMGHNYNNRLRNAEVLWRCDRTLQKIRRAETFDDLLKTIEK